tara:strand:- start:215 stop:568 length:354 start_codon:yes stop_codon:yes gene_type:complete
MNYAFILALIMMSTYVFTSLKIPNAKLRPLERIVALASLFIAIVFTLFPISSSWIAFHLDIDRGTDLIVYTYIATSWIFLNILFRRLKLLENRQTNMMRQFAIMNSEMNNKLLDKDN